MPDGSSWSGGAAGNPIREIHLQNRQEIDSIEKEEDRINKLSELNVVAQVRNICNTSVLHRTFKEGNYSKLHGWVLDIRHGKFIDLELPFGEWLEQGIIPENFKQ